MAAAMDSIEGIERVEKSIARREDRQEECELSADHNQMLEEIAPSCLAISILGRLMLVTHEKDVSLHERPPIGGFKHIKYPHSLRASLVQVSNDGHTAFKTAHINMDQIRLLTKRIPDLLDEVVLATAKGTDRDVEMATRGALEKLGKRARKCADLAKDTQGKYQKVMDEIQELLEASASTKGHLEQIQKENLQRAQILEEKKISLEEEDKMRAEYKKEMKNAVANARKVHSNAMENIPSNMMTLGTAVTQDAVQAVTIFLSYRKAIPAAFKVGSDAVRALGRGKDSQATPKADKSAAQQDHTGPDVATIFAVSESLRLIQALLECFNTKEDNTVSFTEPKGGCIKYETGFKSLCEELAKAKSANEITSGMSELDRSTAQLTQNINEIIKQNSLHGDSEQLKEIKAELEGRLVNVKRWHTRLNQLAQNNPTPTRSPAPKPKQEKDPEPSALAVMRDNAHFRVQQAHEALVMYEENNLAAERRCQESRAKLQQTMVEIKQLDLTKTDMENVQKTLQKGFHALTKVSEVWSELVLFFSKVANMVDATFYENILDFQERATNMLEYDSLFNRSMMYEYAKNATQSSIAIASLSSMYVEVSDKYLMPPLATLPRLIYPNEHESVEALAYQLDHECEEAITRIGIMASEKRAEYGERVKRRLEKIEAARKSLPPISIQEQESNTRAIKTGMDIDLSDF